jgi:peptidoglycan/LPS O-acetylase OafA/YrhL
VLGFILLVAAVIYKPMLPRSCSGGILYLPGAVLLIYGLAGGKGFFAQHLSSRSLLLLGNASFAFYLVHLPIIRIGKAVLLMVHREIVSWPAILVAALILYVLAQTAAIGIFKYFEIPVQTFLRGVFRGRHRNHLQPTSAARN